MVPGDSLAVRGGSRWFAVIPTGLGNAKYHLFYCTFCIWSRPKSHPTRIRPVLVVWVRLGFVLDAFWLRFGSVLRLSGRIECKFASDRLQIAPKSAHNQIKHILPKDFRMS